MVRPDGCGPGEVVTPAGVDLLGEAVQPRVFIGVGDLGGNERLGAEFALRVRLQVVVPLRMLGAAVVGGDQNRVGTVVEVGELVFSSQTRLGARADQWRCGDPADDPWVAPTGDAVQPGIEARCDVVSDELAGP